MTQIPSVSAVITCFNSEDTIQAAIDSALRQSVALDQIIVVDDGSHDNSVKLIKEYGDRILLVESHSQSPSGARNAGIERCMSHFIAFLDGDDVWHEDKTKTQLAAALLNPHCDVIACDWSRDLEKINCEVAQEVRVYAADIAVINKFQTSTALVKREVFDMVGNFDPDTDVAEDWDMWLRIAKHGSALILRAPMVFYRDNVKGVSKNVSLLRKQIATILAREYTSDYFSREFISILRAWHHQRFIVAALLSHDVAELEDLIKTLGSSGSPKYQIKAFFRLTLPFLFQRFSRHAKALQDKSIRLVTAMTKVEL